MEYYASLGEIDSLDNLTKVAAYLVGGTYDNIVPTLAVQAMSDLYSHYGVKKIEFLKKDIGHEMQGSDPIGGLKYLYNQLGYAPQGFQPPTDSPYSAGNLSKFDQKEFVPSPFSFDESTFNDYGLFYVPHACQEK